MKSEKVCFPEPKDVFEEGANEEVMKVQETTPVNRKRGPYRDLPPEDKVKLGRFAAENTTAACRRKFREEYGDIPESTVRSYRKLYLTHLQTAGSPSKVLQICHGNRGRPVKLGMLDDKVKTYLYKLRAAGGVVNRTVVLAAARGIIQKYDVTLLAENGGPYKLERKWAESLMNRMNFVRRKATKAARKVPADLEKIRDEFLTRIKTVTSENSIPDELILNLDQTACKLVPTSEWTMTTEGSKQVEVIGCEDKRQITVVLAIAMDGTLLPPQVIYSGKTNKCHAAVTFPDSWNITHTENHWSNTQTMIEFAQKVLIPYCSKVRQLKDLPNTQPALLIQDVFAAHRTEAYLSVLRNHHIFTIFVPAGTTGELQPLDVDFNDDFKVELKNHFIMWYAEKVANSMDEEGDIDKVCIGVVRFYP